MTDILSIKFLDLFKERKMAITVIESAPKTTTCLCGCKFSYTIEDLGTFYPDADWTESGRKAKGIKCPQCSHIQEVDEFGNVKEGWN